MRLFLRPVLVALGVLAIPRRESTKQEPRPLRAPFTLCAGGDVTLGTNLDPKWARYAADTLQNVYGLRPHPDSLATSLAPLFNGAQVVLVNVEGAIGSGPVPPKCGPRSKNCFAFRQPIRAAAALRHLADSSAAVVGNIANNHSRDAGDAGRDSTIAHLAAAGVLVTGSDTLATAVPLPSGDTIGVLGFHTDSATPDARDLAAVRRHVARAVAEFGTVIVTMHLGAEGPTAQRTRNAVELFLKSNRGNPVAFANAAFAAGATLIVGHGPHVLRAGEWRGDRLALYSLGNLLTYGPFKLRDPTDRGVVACVTIDSARHVSAAELRPTMQLWPGVLRPDSSKRAWTLIDSLSALDFPRTGVAVDSTGRLVKRDTGHATRDTRRPNNRS